jgi:acetyl-CoA C-acetyltransferase
MSDALIFDALRTPRGLGKTRGSLHLCRPVTLMSTLLRALIERHALPSAEIEDVIVGCVTQTAEQGGCLARFAALEAGLDERVAGMTLNRFCGSGLQAVHQAAALIVAGYADLLVAGGVESMSRVPMGSDGGVMYEPSTLWRVPSVPQGIAADLLATLRGISREQADRLALTSQQRACAARDRGDFARSLVPLRDVNGLLLLESDEYPRPATTLEKLAALAPAFERLGQTSGVDALIRPTYPQVERVDHIHTAGNSSGIVDGAAAVLVGSRDKGRALGLLPRARIRSIACVGTEPTVMLTGPIPATELALRRAGMTLADIDLIEINEAFAAVVLATIEELEIDPARVNVNGGAIALGHPLGATGAMLLGTLIDALEQRDLATGLVTMCIGGGMGIATIIERVA